MVDISTYRRTAVPEATSRATDSQIGPLGRQAKTMRAASATPAGDG